MAGLRHQPLGREAPYYYYYYYDYYYYYYYNFSTSSLLDHQSLEREAPRAGVLT